MAKQLIAAAHLTVDGVLFLKRLMGIDSFPTVLALFDNVYYAHDQAIVDDQTVPVLLEHGLIDLDGNVNPTVAAWMRVLESPDIDVSLRAMEGQRMRRAVVARQGGQHVLAVRRNEEVVLQSVWSSHGSLEDVVAGPMWAAMRPTPDVAAPPAAEFESITMPLARATELAASAAPGEMIRVLCRDLGMDMKTAKLLNEVSTYSGQRCEITIRESRGIESVQTPAGVFVADTSYGRVISAVRGRGSKLSVTFGPGTYQRFKAAMTDLVTLTPSKDWFAAQAWPQ